MTNETNTPKAEVATGFESTECGRCGGLGQYSYCPAYGTMCFGCRGKKIVLTKRGEAARKFFEASCEVAVETLAVGDVIKCRTMAGMAFATIVSITPGDPNDGNKSLDKVTGEWVPMHTADGFMIETNKVIFFAKPGTVVRKGQSAEEKKAKLEAAYAYQATLTKAGTVAKRKAK